MKDLETIRTLCADEKYSDALTAIREVKQAGFRDAALLTLEGIAIQMGDGDDASLADAKAALAEAAAMTEDHPEAHLEAGYFMLNVHDDADDARPHFDHALDTLRRLVTDAIVGMAKCIEEIDGEAAAAQFIEAAPRRVLDAETIKAKLEE